MNTGLVETAFSNALKSALPTLTVLKMVDDDDIPSLSSFVTVSVTNSEHVAGNLWRVNVATEVHTPAPLIESGSHSSVVDSIVSVVEGASFAADYNSATPAITHLCSGSKLVSSEGGIEDNRYRHSLVILLGVEFPLSSP